MRWPWQKRSRIIPEDLAPEAKSYLSRFESRQPRSIAEEEYVVLDLETTGLDPEKDRILSFAMLRISGMEIRMDQRMEGYLLPESDQRLSGVEIHHVTRGDLLDGVPPELFARSALAFIRDAVLVGHHVAFDIRCLERLIEGQLGCKLMNRSVDTAKLGARLENPLMGSYAGKKAFKNLDTLCSDYGISPEARHSAGGDTYTTALLFLKLLGEARARGIDKW